MKVNKLRILEGINIFGDEKLIFLKVENLYRKELNIVLTKFMDICVAFDFEDKLYKIYEEDTYIYIYISYSHKEIALFILENLIKGEEVSIIKDVLRGRTNERWYLPLEKICNANKIPCTVIDEANLQLGYGSKAEVVSIKESKENWKDIIDNINKGCGIPIITVTGTNGKTSTSRLIHKLLLELGYRSGLSSTGGIYIGNEVIKHGDTTGFYSARLVLNNKNVDVAVLETARGGIIKKGIGFRESTVCIITSLSEDHMGMDNVDDLEKLLDIKAITANGLKDDGKIIIRAIPILYNRFKDNSNIILFNDERNEIIDEHIKNNGEAYFVEDKFITHYYKGVSHKVVKVKEIPFTHYGYSKSNIRNVLTAIAAVRTINIRIEDIIEKLKNIKCDLHTNLGRQNIIDFDKFQMMIDYGHNSEAFYEVFNIAKGLKPSKITGIITAPGDRGEKYIIELGEIAAKFCENIIIKEQPDLRGREEGETAKLLLSGVLKSGFDKNNVKILLSEEEAIDYALQNAINDELIVSFSQFLYLTIPVINYYLRNKSMEEIVGLDLSH